LTRVLCHVSISLDGFIAGPDQSEDHPLGKGGLAVHAWHLQEPADMHPADRAMSDDLMQPIGAVVMGRNMFGPIRGEWTGDWQGWWGEEPPYHAPVFVLTHHEREPVELTGTTFHFVTGGFGAALAQAREAAGDGDIRVAGGASTIRQALVARAVDELVLDIAPVLLGSGERIFDADTRVTLEPVEVQSSPLATHVRYRVG
jgi:dihydrofolate reductase